MTENRRLHLLAAISTGAVLGAAGMIFLYAPQDAVVVPLDPGPADPLPHRQPGPLLVVLVGVGPDEADERTHQRPGRVDPFR